MTRSPHSRARAGPVVPARRDAVPPRRGPVRRFLEVRGLVGRHAAPHRHVRLLAGDGVRLAGTLVDGPHPDAPAVVLVHGFAAHRRKPAYARLADGLSVHVHVLALDLRGHGRSAGETTLGDREALDVAAAVAWLRGRGHDDIVLVGASMGATSILHAMATGTRADAAVVISAPARLEEDPASDAMRRLKRIWESRLARVLLRVGIGVRVVAPRRWRRPGHPVEFAASVDVPLLVVHGRDDAYFPVADARALAAASPGAALWLEPDGFGHAEDGFSPAFADRLGTAITAALDKGRFPDATAGAGR